MLGNDAGDLQRQSKYAVNYKFTVNSPSILQLECNEPSDSSECFAPLNCFIAPNGNNANL